MLLGIFAALGLALAAVGQYGVLGFLVAQRTGEIGVRMALGATPSAIIRMVMGNTWRWLAVGFACGLVCSVVVARAVASLLYGVSEYDPLAWVLAAAVLVAVAFVAAWIPSSRAAHIDPIVALRHD